MDIPYPAGGGVSPATLQAMGATRPWMRCCAIFGFLWSLFMLVYGVAIAFFGVTFGQTPSPQGRAAPDMTAIFTVVGVFYLLMAAVQTIVAIKLWKVASSIGKVSGSAAVEDLEQHVEQTRGFWKLLGIMVIVSIVSVILLVIGIFVVAMASVAR